MIEAADCRGGGEGPGRGPGDKGEFQTAGRGCRQGVNRSDVIGREEGTKGVRVMVLVQFQLQIPRPSPQAVPVVYAKTQTAESARRCYLLQHQGHVRGLENRCWNFVDGAMPISAFIKQLCVVAHRIVEPGDFNTQMIDGLDR